MGGDSTSSASFAAAVSGAQRGPGRGCCCCYCCSCCSGNAVFPGASLDITRGDCTQGSGKRLAPAFASIAGAATALPASPSFLRRSWL